MKTDKEIIGFQGIRGLAIVLIIISHCNWMLNSHGQNVLMWAGAWGVSCFIMLSGFLTVNRYFHTDISYKQIPRLVKHKLKKCYPLHLLTLIIAVPISVSLMDEASSIKDIIKFILNASLLQSWIPISNIYFSYNAVAWYLSMDLGLLLLLPIVLWIFRALNSKQIKISLCFVLIIEIALALVAQKFKIAHWIVYVCPVSRSLDYFVGGGIALIARNSVKENDDYERRNFCVLVGALILGTLLVFASMDSESELFSSAAWVTPSVLLLLSVYRGENNAVGSIFKKKGLVFIGNISFELFLIHQLVIRYMTSMITHMGLEINSLIYVTAILVSIILAALLNRKKQKIKN